MNKIIRKKKLMAKIIFKKSKLFLTVILLFLISFSITTAVVVFGTDGNPVVLGNNTSNNTVANQFENGTMEQLRSSIQINSYAFDGSTDMCEFGGRDDPLKNNMSDRNYVPVTSDIMENEGTKAARNTNYKVYESCLHNKSAAIIRSQFMIKHVTDIKWAFNQTLFSGNSAYGPGFNTMMQNISDRNVASVIYNEANIENACSPFKQPLKQYLNRVFANRNITRADYLIRDLTCSLSSDSGGNHESSFSIYNDPSVASWNSWYAGPNLIKDAIGLESDLKEANRVGEELVRNDQRDGQGTQSLYKCTGTDGETRRGTLLGKPNTYLLNPIDGEFCEKISSGLAINQERNNALNLAKNMALNARDVFTTFPELMKGQIVGLNGSAFDAHAGVSGSAALQNIQAAFAQDMGSLGGQSASVGLSLANQLFNSIVNFVINEIVKRNSESENKRIDAVSKVAILEECLLAHEGQTTNDFEVGFAKTVVENVRGQLNGEGDGEMGELTLKLNEYKEFVQGHEKQITDLIVQLSLGGGESGATQITIDIKKLRDEIKDHPLAGIGREIEAYISQHVVSANPDSVEILTGACLLATWEGGGDAITSLGSE